MKDDSPEPNETERTSNMKTYSFETLFRSLKDQLAAFLRDAGIFFEVSGTGAFCGWYFSIRCTPEQAADVSAFLDAVTIINQD